MSAGCFDFWIVRQEFACSLGYAACKTGRSVCSEGERFCIIVAAFVVGESENSSFTSDPVQSFAILPGGLGDCSICIFVVDFGFYPNFNSPCLTRDNSVLNPFCAGNKNSC